MDKLADRLREDAAAIDVRVSPELDNRIRASLEATAPVVPREESAPRSPLFWWASSLTGLGAAIALIAILNVEEQPPATAPVAETTPAVSVPELPSLPLNARTATITSPLEKELDDLESDLEKARRAVSEDVRLIF